MSKRSKGMLWVEICPLKRSVEVLDPDTCECDLIWKQGFCRCPQVKMQLLEWALIHCDWCLTRTGKLRHRFRHRENAL